MLPGAPEGTSVLLRNGAWADEAYADTGRGQWAPLTFPSRAAAAEMIRRMKRNRGYLPDRDRWKGETPP